MAEFCHAQKIQFFHITNSPPLKFYTMLSK